MKLLLALWGSLAFWTSAACAGVNLWSAIGPEGAYVTAISIDPATPSTVYAGTRGAGVLKSADSGASWGPLNTGLSVAHVSSIAVDPRTPGAIYAGTDAGLFKSTDGGGHWTAANGGLNGELQLTIYALAMDAGSPPTLYAATAGGLFKSGDGAASFTSINAGLAGLTPRVVTIDPVTPTIVYIGVDSYDDDNGYGVMKSVDAGASWKRVYSSLPYGDGGAPSVVAIAVHPHSPSSLYVALGGNDLLKSADGGATWRKSAEDVPVLSSLAIDSASPSILYAGSYLGGIYRSIDAGDHWTQASIGLPAATGVNVIVTTPTAVFAGLVSGIVLSIDGTTWTALGLGVRGVSVSPFVADPSAASTIHGIAFSGPTNTTDGGAHWTSSELPDAGAFVNAIAIDPLTPTTLYVGGDASARTKVYKSTDGGRHWTSSSDGLSFGGLQALALAPSRSSTLYVGQAFAGVLKSVDGGASWIAANNGLTAVGIYVSAIAVHPVDADTIYVATPPTGNPDTNSKVFKSTNGAAQWKQVSFPVSRETLITSFVFDPVTPSVMYATYVDYVAKLGGVYESRDGGETWMLHENTLPTQWSVAIAIDPKDPSRIYAATQSGVYVSVDAAASWSPLNAGLPSLDVWTIAVDSSGTLLRAGASDGLFEYKVVLALPRAVPLIEYFHPGFGHYFVTSIADEIAKLDSGVLAGWQRTGLAFNVYDAAGSATVPVCRFVSTSFAQKSSHVYATPAECDVIRTNKDWQLESAAAFYIAAPAADGSCAAGLAPVYRLYNDGQGGAPNHRYVTGLQLRAEMVAQGWVPEGLGASGVEMCAPR